MPITRKYKSYRPSEHTLYLIEYHGVVEHVSWAPRILNIIKLGIYTFLNEPVTAALGFFQTLLDLVIDLIESRRICTKYRWLQYF